MKKKYENTKFMRLRVKSSHDKKLEEFKQHLNTEYQSKISKNGLVRIAIAEFLKYNHNVVKLKKTLEKYAYI